MKFQQVQALKHKAYAAFVENRPLDVPPVLPYHMDAITLAFVGDAYYALFLRRRLTALGIPAVQVLHALAAEFVSAKCQSFVYTCLQSFLTEAEKSLCRRSRNAYSQVPKSASAAEYHNSTALEALIGYLVLDGQEARLQAVMQHVLAAVRAYCQKKHT